MTKVLTVVGAVLLKPLLAVAKSPINADPPSDGKGWEIPIDAPKLPLPFLPEATRFGQSSKDFDEGYDPMGNTRNKDKTSKSADDPYDQHRDQVGQDGQHDRPMGDDSSENQQRYEDRARLRMQARRAELADRKTHEVSGESADGEATEEYTKWRNSQISDFLKDGINMPATDHSTIVTNAMHAERATAYDVAIGVCRFSDSEWRDFRIEADWRYAIGLQEDHPHLPLSMYFADGRMNNQEMAKWANEDKEAAMPSTVVDKRAFKLHRPRHEK